MRAAKHRTSLPNALAGVAYKVDGQADVYHYEKSPQYLYMLSHNGPNVLLAALLHCITIKSRSRLSPIKKFGMSQKRFVADCRKFPSEKNCDVYMSGSKEHVVDAAVQHAVGSHGHADTPELRKQVEDFLTEEQVRV